MSADLWDLFLSGEEFDFMEQTVLQTATSIARYLNVCHILEIFLSIQYHTKYVHMHREYLMTVNFN